MPSIDPKTQDSREEGMVMLKPLNEKSYSPALVTLVEGIEALCLRIDPNREGLLRDIERAVEDQKNKPVTTVRSMKNLKKYLARCNDDVEDVDEIDEDYKTRDELYTELKKRDKELEERDEEILKLKEAYKVRDREAEEWRQAWDQIQLDFVAPARAMHERTQLLESARVSEQAKTEKRNKLMRNRILYLQEELEKALKKK